MDADPRAAYSYRHPRSGEWAHPLHADPLTDAFASTVDPAWELLAARVRTAPEGPPGAERRWRALIIGFGRGFEAVALLRRLAQEAPGSLWEIVGLEPYPDRLEPWPPRWSGLEPAEAPWWGGDPARITGSGPHALQIRRQRADEWLRAAPRCGLDLVLVDLFSPARHPEDWDPGVAAGLAAAAAPGAALAGYCCARVWRDGLAQAGWSVEILRRPGWRDTLRALRGPSGPP